MESNCGYANPSLSNFTTVQLMARVAALEAMVEKFTSTNSPKVETVTNKQCHAYAEQVCNHNCIKCKHWY